MITLHRYTNSGAAKDELVAIPVANIQQIHEGRGGVTIITTPIGQLAVEESFADVLDKIEDRG